jgi:hypothetical protein
MVARYWPIWRAISKQFFTAMLSLITLPSTAVADLTANIGTLATDLWPVIVLAISIPLAFYVIGRVIGMFRTRAK